MRSPHTSYRWRERERVIEPIKVCAHHTSYRWRGERVIEPIKYVLPHTIQVERRESHRANQVYARHTPATGGEERES